MRRFRTFVALVGTALLLVALGILVASPARASGRASARVAAPVKLSAAHILVTPKGQTLYVFAADPQKKSTCYGTCAKFWPPRLVSKTAHPPATMAGIAGTFGVITRTDGTRQLTYDGAPLYTFLEDKQAGQVNGQGSFASGGYWWAVVAAGK